MRRVSSVFHPCPPPPRSRRRMARRLCGNPAGTFPTDNWRRQSPGTPSALSVRGERLRHHPRPTASSTCRLQSAPPLVTAWPVWRLPRKSLRLPQGHGHSHQGNCTDPAMGRLSSIVGALLRGMAPRTCKRHRTRLRLLHPSPMRPRLARSLVAARKPSTMFPPQMAVKGTRSRDGAECL